MAANEQTSVTIVVDVQNRNEIDLLKKQVLDLSKAANTGSVDLSKYGEKIKEANKAAVDSNNALKAQISLWEQVRDNVSRSSPLYAEVSGELVRLKAELNDVSRAYTNVAATSAKANAGMARGGGVNPYLPSGARRPVVPTGPSQAELAAQAEARTKLLENIGLGVGFPLMFGGGLGATLGGGLGSFVGTGFAGQIVGSAIGMKFDEFAKSASDFAKSMREGGDAAGYLKQTLGYLDPSIERTLTNLQKSGQTAKAAELAFTTMARNIGEENARVLKELGEGWDSFGRGFQRTTLTMLTSYLAFLDKIKQAGGPNNPITNPGGETLSIINKYFGGQPKKPEQALTPEAQNRIAASRDQVALAEAESAAASTTLKDNVGLYEQVQKRVALSKKIVDYNKILLEATSQQITVEEKVNKVKELELQYRKQIVTIERQAQDERRRAAEEAQRKAEEAQRKALQQQRDQQAVLAQAYDLAAQVNQLNATANNIGRSPVDAARANLAVLTEVERFENLSRLARAKQEMEAARLKGTVEQTGALLMVQTKQLAEQQRLRRLNAQLAVVEAEAAERTTKAQRDSNLTLTQSQARQSVAGLMGSVAGLQGQRTYRFDAIQLEEQQRQRQQQEVFDRMKRIENLRSQGFDNWMAGGNIENILKEIDYEEKLLDIKGKQLPIMDALEQQQLRLNDFAKQYGSIFNSVGSALTNTFDLLITGTDNWGDSLRNVAATALRDVAKQLLQVFVINQLVSGITGLFAPKAAPGLNISDALKYSANGNVFAQNGIMPFANGGVVTRPVLFPFANGVGLMGEAGPEAIMPLKRGRDGKLGVAADGSGGGVSVNVSVDASGSKVEGDTGTSARLGRVIASAIQAELVKQKRPGGLLAA